MRTALGFAIVTSVILPASLFADPAPAADARRRTAECEHARPEARCVFNFDPEDVAGKAATPDDIGIRIMTFGKAGSLVAIRRHFIPEILKTAEDL
jgi:hypothetical protein